MLIYKHSSCLNPFYLYPVNSKSVDFYSNSIPQQKWQNSIMLMFHCQTTEITENINFDLRLFQEVNKHFMWNPKINYQNHYI